MDDTEPGSTRSRAIQKPVVISAVVICVALVCAYVFWWSTPTALAGGGQVSFDAHPAPLSTTPMLVQLNPGGGDEEILVKDLQPVIVTNTAESTFDFFLCSSMSEFNRIGFVSDPPEDHCVKTAPVLGESFNPQHKLDYIVMAITPHKTGRTHVEGVDVTYRRSARYLRQTGTERIGPEVAFNPN